VITGEKALTAGSNRDSCVIRTFVSIFCIQTPEIWAMLFQRGAQFLRSRNQTVPAREGASGAAAAGFLHPCPGADSTASGNTVDGDKRQRSVFGLGWER
jgi:hypothetical protein